MGWSWADETDADPSKNVQPPDLFPGRQKNIRSQNEENRGWENPVFKQYFYARMELIRLHIKKRWIRLFKNIQYKVKNLGTTKPYGCEWRVWQFDHHTLKLIPKSSVLRYLWTGCQLFVLCWAGFFKGREDLEGVVCWNRHVSGLRSSLDWENWSILISSQEFCMSCCFLTHRKESFQVHLPRCLHWSLCNQRSRQEISPRCSDSSDQ